MYFVDISLKELKSDKINVIKDNLSVFKRIGRVTNVNKNDLDANGVKIIVDGETITLYFDQTINLSEQKQKLLIKADNINNKLNSAVNKLKNKSFLKKAPKQIVEKEKKALKDYKIEHKKLNSILNSIKN